MSAVAGTAAAAGVIAVPVGAHLIKKRTAAFRRVVKDIVTEVTGELRSEVMARIDESDHKTKRSVDELKASVEAIKEKAHETDLKMAVQFGGNGGGIRQAINEQSQAVNEQGLAIAQLTGRFDQHLQEVSK
jgi:hypothetical protein